LIKLFVKLLIGKLLGFIFSFFRLYFNSFDFFWLLFHRLLRLDIFTLLFYNLRFDNFYFLFDWLGKLSNWLGQVNYFNSIENI